MRIAIAAEEGTGLSRPVSVHFGRCPCFVIMEIRDDNPAEFEVVDNPFYGQVGHIPGGWGGGAIGFFREYGIEPVTGAGGTVEEAVMAYLTGERTGADPCRESIEHGHGQQSGPGEGQGEGRGGGRGLRRRFEP
jgi:predicted Fe-Mo cluster-binding NifX family protein